MPKKRNHESCSVDLDRLLVDFESPDESVRASAVRKMCPCRIGFESFEPYLRIVREMAKDPSPLVQKAALHILQDTEEMKSGGLPTNPREIHDDMLATKRRMRGRFDETDDDLPRTDKRLDKKDRPKRRNAATCGTTR